LQKTPALNPDIIIVGLYLCEHAASGNDLLDNLNDVYKATDVKKDASQQNKKLGKVGFLRHLRRLLKKHSNLYRVVETRVGSLVLAKLSGAMDVHKDDKLIERAWEVTDSLLVQLKSESMKRKAFLVLQYCPNLLDIARSNDKVYNKLEKLGRRNRIAVAPNPITVFHNQKSNFSIGDYYFLVDGHWTEEAHRVCAQEMAKIILKNFDVMEESGCKP
jgi:hypothetical protein